MISTNKKWGKNGEKWKKSKRFLLKN